MLSEKNAYMDRNHRQDTKMLSNIYYNLFIIFVVVFKWQRIPYITHNKKRKEKKKLCTQ